MNRLLAIPTSVLLSAVMAGCALPAEKGPGPIVYRVSGMDKVQVKNDLTYKKVGASELRFDLYLPAGNTPKDGWPVVVLIHGGPVPGSVRPKDWPAYQSYGRVLGASGVAAVTCNYRFPSPESLPAAAEDLAELLSHVRGRAKEFALNPDRMGLWAFSGGGPQLSFAVRESPAYIRCIVSFYARLDAPSEQARYSPLAQLRATSKQIPPMFIARAGKDFPEFNRSVDAFTDEARKRNAPVQVENYPEGVHAFDIVSDTDASRAVIAKAVSFVKDHLLGGPQAVTSGYLAVADDAKLYYQVCGDGPAVVLVHDGLLHSAGWDRQWDALSRNYRVVRYDRRGYGRSTWGSKPYSHVDDLDRLVRHLGLTRLAIIGASAGGNLALEYTLAHPNAVTRLVLVGPVVNGLAYSDHFRARNRAAFRPLAEGRDVKEVVANWVNDPYLTAPGNTAAKERLRELLEASPHNLTRPGGLERSGQPPPVGRLAEIKIPTLILVGEADIPDVHAHCGAIQAGITAAKRVVMSKAGHLPFIERPDEFNRLVLDFLTGG